MNINVSIQEVGLVIDSINENMYITNRSSIKKLNCC